ncbi:hypothetical protein HDU98_006031, partial [Podochytrium sp. JEL0797]
MVEAYFDGSVDQFNIAYSLSDPTAANRFPLIFERNIDQGVHDTAKLPLYFQHQL